MTNGLTTAAALTVLLVPRGHRQHERKDRKDRMFHGCRFGGLAVQKKTLFDNSSVFFAPGLPAV